MTETVRGLDGCVRGSLHSDQVRLAVDAMPGPAQIGRVSGLFKLLGDPTRTRLLYALLKAGELCVCDLAEAAGITETTASQALRLLRTAGVVAGRRDGRNVFYRLSDAHVRTLLEVTREHARHDSPPRAATRARVTR